MTTEQREGNSTPQEQFLSRIHDNFEGKDIISLSQFDHESFQTLFNLVPWMKDIALKREKSNILAGDVVTLLFYETSSRTRASFDVAVKQLGGQTVVVENPQTFSSVSKGETFEDTIRTFEAYSDAIVLRHPQKGSAQKAADVAKHVPIINAGDGTGEHPTQALLDLYTIFEHKGKLNGLTGVIAGDIKNGRTVHSLLDGLSLHTGNAIYLLSPDGLRLSASELEKYKKKGLEVIEIRKKEDMPMAADFWYWTRTQKERFKSEEEYQKVNNKFILDQALIDEKAGENTIFMHPLPRVGEILPEVDEDPRAVYLRTQIRNGLYVRMALIALVLGRKT